MNDVCGIGGHAFTEVHGEFPHLKEGQIPLPEFSRTREWLQTAEVTLTGVNENWLAGRLMGVMSIVGEEVGKEWKAVIGTTDNGQRICALNVREQRVDGGCSFMDVNEGGEEGRCRGESS